MDFILDNIFIIILLFVGAISQWLKSRGEAGQPQDPGYDPADLEEMIEEAERRQSRPAVPPPLPPAAFPRTPASVIPSAPSLRRQSRKSREPEQALAAELARQQDLADKLKEMKRTRGAREISESLLTHNRPAGNATHAVATGLRARLGNRRELRQAFVLKEILEKPVGLS